MPRSVAEALRPVVVEPPTPPAPFAQWEAERADALRVAARPTTVAASALTDEGEPDSEGEPDPGLQKRPQDLDLPPWLKGRYGTAVGRAVHGVLQTIDLSSGAGLDEALAAQCEAEAVPDRLNEVRALVLQALGSPSVVEAAASPHWREIYSCTPHEGRLLEGYIDLLYRGADGLVVVDYKTAATSDPDGARSARGGLPAAGGLLRPDRRHLDGRARRPGDVPVPHPGRCRRASPLRSRRQRGRRPSAAAGRRRGRDRLRQPGLHRHGP